MHPVLFSICCLTLSFSALSASEADDRSQTWPDRGPYCEVGDANHGITLRLPETVIAGLRAALPADPSKWGLAGGYDYLRRGCYLLRAFSEPNRHVSLALESGVWINLGAPANVRYLSEVLKRMRSDDLANHKKLEKFIDQVISLRGNPTFVILTPELQQQRFTTRRFIDSMKATDELRIKLIADRDTEALTPNIDKWLLGTEKSRRVLLSLFHEISVEKTERGVTVRCNIMNSVGAVEEWTIRLRKNRTVQVEDVGNR